MFHHHRFDRLDQSRHSTDSSSHLVDMTDSSLQKHFHHANQRHGQQGSAAQLSFDNGIYPQDGQDGSAQRHHCGDSSQTNSEISQLQESLVQLEHVLEEVLAEIAQELKALSDSGSASSSGSTPAAGGDSSGGSGSAGSDGSAGGSSAGGGDSHPASGTDSGTGNGSTPGNDSGTGSHPATGSDSGAGTSPAAGNSGSENVIPGTVSAVWAQQDPQNDHLIIETDNAQDHRLKTQRPTAAEPFPKDADQYTGWILVAGENGAAVDRSAKVQVENMTTYGHLKTGGWIKLEDQSDGSMSQGIGAMQEGIDFSKPFQINVDNSNGMASMAAPPEGQMDHFGTINTGHSTFTPDSIDGVYVAANVKTDKDNTNLIARTGGEAWKMAADQSGQTIESVPGVSNFVKLTSNWQSVHYTSLSKEQLEKDPPPGIVPDSAASGSNNTGGDGTSSGSGSDSSGNTGSGRKMIVPFPSSDAQWQQLVQQLPKDSIVVPMYSGDNTKWDDFTNFGGPALAQHIKQANDAGIKPVGFIQVAAGQKPIDEVKADIDKWYNATTPTSKIAGIYLGAAGKSDASGYATDPASAAYYTEIARYIHSKGGIAVINGIMSNDSQPVPDYVKQNFDIIGTGEATMGPFEAMGAKDSSVPKDKSMVMIAGTPVQDLARVERETSDRGYIYITDIDYGTNPSYLSQEIQWL